MSKTRKGKRTDGDDVYITPRWSINRFLEEWPHTHLLDGPWLDVGAGSGAISRAVVENAASLGNSSLPDVYTVDIRDTASKLVDYVDSDNIFIGDFTDPEFEMPVPTYTPKYNVAIMNPPFRHALAFIERALTISDHVVALLRLNFLGSNKRNQFFRGNMPSIYVVPNRVSFTVDGKTDSCEVAWFHWDARTPQRVGMIRVLDQTPLAERKADRPVEEDFGDDLVLETADVRDDEPADAAE